MELVPGDELDEQFMSRWADQTDRKPAHHKMAKKYVPVGEAMGLDPGTAYEVARRVIAEWRHYTTRPRASEVGFRSRIGAGGSTQGAGGIDHGCRDRGSGDSDDISEIYGWMPPDDARVDHDGRIFG